VAAGIEYSLKTVALFAGLTAEARRAYEQRCIWRSYHRGEQIIGPISGTRDVFFVISGSVRVVSHSSSGREITFADLNAGDLVGELAAIDGGPRSATVVATSDTLLAIMAPATLRQLISDYPDAALLLLTRLANMIRTSTSRIMELSTLGAHNRVYAEILRMAKGNVILNSVTSINPAPTHSDIASRISTTRETVARAMGDLSRLGVISQHHGTLIVKDVARLAEMVEHFWSE